MPTYPQKLVGGFMGGATLLLVGAGLAPGPGKHTATPIKTVTVSVPAPAPATRPPVTVTTTATPLKVTVTQVKTVTVQPPNACLGLPALADKLKKALDVIGMYEDQMTTATGNYKVAVAVQDEASINDTTDKVWYYQNLLLDAEANYEEASDILKSTVKECDHQ